MLDLEPATCVLTRIAAGVRDEQLNAPTPGTAATLGDLLDGLIGLGGRDPAWNPEKSRA